MQTAFQRHDRVEASVLHGAALRCKCSRPLTLNVTPKEGENPKEKSVNIEFFNDAVKAVTEIDCQAFRADEKVQKYGEEESIMHVQPKFKFIKQVKTTVKLSELKGTTVNEFLDKRERQEFSFHSLKEIMTYPKLLLGEESETLVSMKPKEGD